MSDEDLTTHSQPATTTTRRGTRTQNPDQPNNPKLKPLDMNSTLRADIAQSTKILKAKLTGVKDSMRATSANTTQTLQNGVSDLQAQIATLRDEVHSLRTAIAPTAGDIDCGGGAGNATQRNTVPDAQNQIRPVDNQLQEIINAQEDLRRDVAIIRNEIAEVKTAVRLLVSWMEPAGKKTTLLALEQTREDT